MGKLLEGKEPGGEATVAAALGWGAWRAALPDEPGSTELCPAAGLPDGPGPETAGLPDEPGPAIAGLPSEPGPAELCPAAAPNELGVLEAEGTGFFPREGEREEEEEEEEPTEGEGDGGGTDDGVWAVAGLGRLIIRCFLAGTPTDVRPLKIPVKPSAFFGGGEAATLRRFNIFLL